MSIKAKLRALRNVYPVTFAGETFYVRALSINGLNSIRPKAAEGCPEGTTDDELETRYRKQLLADTVCDEKGATEFEGCDDPDFNDVPTDALKVLIEAAAEHNGLKAEPGKD